MCPWNGLPLAPPPWVIGHRGYAGRAPENTLASFEAAIRAGAHVVETDVRLTADGVAVCLHDPTVDRTADGTGRVSQMDLAAVERLDAGSWYGPAWRRTRVPLLETALALYGDRVVFDLELKVEEEEGEARAHMLAREVLRLVHKVRLDGRVVLSSFDTGLLAHLAAAAPAVPRVLLVDRVPSADALAAVLEATGASWLAPDASRLVEGEVRRVAERSVPVVPYTVDDAPRMNRLLDWGVLGLFTNEVRLLADVVGSRS